MPRKPLIILGVSVLVVVGGLIFGSGTPKPVQATIPKLDVANMTAEELADNGSFQAARELTRRMTSGTMNDRAAVSIAINARKSMRLGRNLASAMALEQQKRMQNMVRQVEGNRRMAEDGPYEGMPQGGRPVFRTSRRR